MSTTGTTKITTSAMIVASLSSASGDKKRGVRGRWRAQQDEQPGNHVWFSYAEAAHADGDTALAVPCRAPRAGGASLAAQAQHVVSAHEMSSPALDTYDCSRGTSLGRSWIAFIVRRHDLHAGIVEGVENIPVQRAQCGAA